METGNPKQVAALAVVAVGAFGFLFTRLGGKPLLNTPQAAASAPRATASRRLVALATGHDPFSHPKLAPKETRAVPEEVSPPTTTAKLAGLIGTLPPVGPYLPDAPLPNTISDEKSKTPEPPKRLTIGLEAIASASDTVAFLSVGGAESQPFRPHDRITGAIRLLRFQDGAVVLSGPKGELTLGVGERITL